MGEKHSLIPNFLGKHFNQIEGKKENDVILFEPVSNQREIIGFRSLLENGLLYYYLEFDCERICIAFKRIEPINLTVNMKSES